MTHLAHWSEASRVRREVGEIATWMTDLGTAAGSVATGVRRWEIDPGRRPTPPHAHGGEEEIFYVLGGSGLLWLDGDVCEVGAGDAIVHRADEEAHTLKAGPDGLDVLAFGMRIYTENCYHPHSGRVWTGPTIVAAEGPKDMFALDAAAGPLAWAEPGPRPANVVNAADVDPDQIDVGDCRSSARRPGRRGGLDPDGPQPGHGPGRLPLQPAALPLSRGGAVRDPRGLGHVHPRRGRARRALRARHRPAGRHRGRPCPAGRARTA